MFRNVMFGSVAALGLTLIAACNQETSYNTTPATPPSSDVATTEPPAGSNSDTVSAVQDAVAGGVGTLSAEFTTTTKGFAQAAAMSDMYEVEASKIALNRSKSTDIKAFARDMVDGHMGTTTELKAVLAKAAPDVETPANLDSRREGMIDNLKGASDADFDGRYIAQQINAHNEAMILMRGYAKDGDNPDVKAFAKETEPTIEMHLDMIKQIDKVHSEEKKQAQDQSR
jgi:putative membrane protein